MSSITVNQAAERLGVTPCTIRRWIRRREGGLPAHWVHDKLGRHYEIDVGELMIFERPPHGGKRR